MLGMANTFCSVGSEFMSSGRHTKSFRIWTRVLGSEALVSDLELDAEWNMESACKLSQRHPLAAMMHQLRTEALSHICQSPEIVILPAHLPRLPLIFPSGSGHSKTE